MPTLLKHIILATHLPLGFVDLSSLAPTWTPPLSILSRHFSFLSRSSFSHSYLFLASWLCVIVKEIARLFLFSKLLPDVPHESSLEPQGLKNPDRPCQVICCVVSSLVVLRLEKIICPGQLSSLCPKMSHWNAESAKFMTFYWEPCARCGYFPFYCPWALAHHGGRNTTGRNTRPTERSLQTNVSRQFPASSRMS